MRVIAFAISFFLASQLSAARAEFMGLKVDAKSVAFVCDGSRWIEDKDDELIYELSSAIDGMKSEQQFAVVFFANGKTQAFNEAKLLPATDENKRKIRSWLKEIRFAGDSTPMPGLTLGLQSNAESVVFLTSGEFRNFDEIESKVESLNKDRKIRVHTVGYFRNEKDDDSRTFHQFMKRLADRNGGKAVVAYADELRRKR